MNLAIFTTMALITILSTSFCLFADAAKPKFDKKALEASAEASKKWLQLVDQGKYAESWKQSSGLMRLTIPADEWVHVLDSVRKPLGSVQSRTVADQRVAENPKGLPPGHYMVMFYKTSFSNKKDAAELITLFSEDGDWRVMTYQVN